MSTDEAQRSARETLWKIADELQTRRADLAHRMGLESAAVAPKMESKSIIETGLAAASGSPKPSVETLIQAAVEALGPRYENPPKVAPIDSRPAGEKQPAPPTELPPPTIELVVDASGNSPVPAAETEVFTASEVHAALPVSESAPPVEPPAPVAKEAPKPSYSWPLPAAKSAPEVSDVHPLPDVDVIRPATEAPAEPATYVSIPERPAPDDRRDDEFALEPVAAEAEPVRPLEPPPPFVGAAVKPTSAAAAAAPASFGTRMARAAVQGLDDTRTRSVVTTYFPMLIAVLALAAAIYQGYLFHAGLDVLQRNVQRSDYLRACRDLIEGYYAVKQKVSVLMPAVDRSNVAGASRVTENNRIEAQAAVARFSALSNYLAAVQDPGTRARYAELMRTLSGTIDTARMTQLTEIDKMFEPADKLFAIMNDDCTRLSRPVRM